jgi:hypothetical protein
MKLKGGCDRLFAGCLEIGILFSASPTGCGAGIDELNSHDKSTATAAGETALNVPINCAASASPCFRIVRGCGYSQRRTRERLSFENE